MTVLLTFQLLTPQCFFSVNFRQSMSPQDAPVVNAIRKWGPVQLLLLQDGTRPEPIHHLIQSFGGYEDHEPIQRS